MFVQDEIIEVRGISTKAGDPLAPVTHSLRESHKACCQPRRGI